MQVDASQKLLSARYYHRYCYAAPSNSPLRPFRISRILLERRRARRREAHVAAAAPHALTAAAPFCLSAPTAPMVVLAVLAGLASAFALYKLARLALADADLNLLSKGPAPPAAFEGKVVWVTGASQGIGKLVSTALAKRGAKLIISARSADRLEVSHCSGLIGGHGIAGVDRARLAITQVHRGDDAMPTRVQAFKQELASVTKDVLVLPLDLTGPFPALEQASQQADAAFGGQGVDFLVHNAGGCRRGLLT